MQNTKSIPTKFYFLWPLLFSVAAASCGAFSIPPNVKNPPTSISTSDPVRYGESVTWMCIVPGRASFQRSQTCVYDYATQRYQLMGDPVECGCKYTGGMPSQTQNH